MRHGSVRVRLTLLFGGLFLVAGAALLGITYGLVSHVTSGIIVNRISSSYGLPGAGSAGSRAAGAGSASGTSAANFEKATATRGHRRLTLPTGNGAG